MCLALGHCSIAECFSNQASSSCTFLCCKNVAINLIVKWSGPDTWSHFYHNFIFWHTRYTPFSQVLGRAHAQIKQIRKGLKDTGVWPLLATRQDVVPLFFPREAEVQLTPEVRWQVPFILIVLELTGCTSQKLHGIMCFLMLSGHSSMHQMAPCQRSQQWWLWWWRSNWHRQCHHRLLSHLHWKR